MARKKTPECQANVKALLAARLREIREELFGERGGTELARRLNIPVRTWYNYESGVTVPAEVLLAFVVLTNVNTAWLYSGAGPKYDSRSDELLLTPLGLIRYGLEKLEKEQRTDEAAQF